MANIEEHSEITDNFGFDPCVSPICISSLEIVDISTACEEIISPSGKKYTRFTFYWEVCAEERTGTIEGGGIEDFEIGKTGIRIILAGWEDYWDVGLRIWKVGLDFPTGFHLTKLTDFELLQSYTSGMEYLPMIVLEGSKDKITKEKRCWRYKATFDWEHTQLTLDIAAWQQEHGTPGSIWYNQPKPLGPNIPFNFNFFVYAKGYLLSPVTHQTTRSFEVEEMGSRGDCGTYEYSPTGITWEPCIPDTNYTAGKECPYCYTDSTNILDYNPSTWGGYLFGHCRPTPKYVEMILCGVSLSEEGECCKAILEEAEAIHYNALILKQNKTYPCLWEICYNQDCIKYTYDCYFSWHAYGGIYIAYNIDTSSTTYKSDWKYCILYESAEHCRRKFIIKSKKNCLSGGTIEIHWGKGIDETAYTSCVPNHKLVNCGPLNLGP